MKRRDRVQLVIFALSALVYFPFSEWVSTTRIGTMLLLWGQGIYLFPLMAAVLATPILLVCLFFQCTRPKSLFLLVLSVLFIACCFGGVRLSHKARMAGMEAFARRSQPLIAAINKYERDHFSPPGSLNDLVPDYLPAVPSTGMMAYPEYNYHVGGEAKEQYRDNRWAISVFTPSGGINFDRMLYFPNQDYPELAWIPTV